MSYKKATHVLPRDLLEKIQEYVDGEFLYIPRVTGNKKDWGAPLHAGNCGKETTLFLRSI